MVASGGARRHPRWGVVAQIAGASGVVLLVLAIALTWVGYGFSDQGVDDLVSGMDDAAAVALEQVNGVAFALDEQALATVDDPDTRAVLAQGAELARGVANQVSPSRRSSMGR